MKTSLVKLTEDIQIKLNNSFIKLFCNKKFLSSNGFLDNIEDSLTMGFIVITNNKEYMQKLFNDFYKNNPNIKITLEEVTQYIYQSKIVSNAFINTVIKYYKDQCMEKINSLLELDDKPGDKININEKNFNYYNRDKAFLYIDGIIYVGNKNETHSDIIAHYFNKENQLRPNENDIGKKVVFGHLIKDIAFIDASESINPKDITSKLKEDLQVKKVYLIPLDNEFNLIKLE